VFGEIPGPWTWSGLALIAGSGIYIAVRETKIKNAQTG
jgi:drug/metabolite transporter (DMT)-like permease